MTRKPNATPSSPAGTEVVFQPHEVAWLKRNATKGGAQDLEHWILDHTDAVTGRCLFDPVHFERACRICRKYGPGGPNTRIRRACIPAFRRVGIDLLPEWRAPA